MDYYIYYCKLVYLQYFIKTVTKHYENLGKEKNCTKHVLSSALLINFSSASNDQSESVCKFFINTHLYS